MNFFPSWNDINIGDSVTFYRTFTEEDVENFIKLTGDFNPFHTDEYVAKQCGFKGRVVPGLLTSSMIAHAGGTLIPEPYAGAKVFFRYLAPVYVGESICACVTVTSKDSLRKKLSLKITCTNQQGNVVLEGEVSGKIFPVLSARNNQ